MEPKYPGAVEQLVNLSGCWDAERLYEQRTPIISLCEQISRCHEHCCRFLGAANSLLTDTYRIALEATSPSKAAKAAGRIVQAEFHQHTGVPRGKDRARLLSAVTNKGIVRFDETARLLCDRIYLIEDDYGASSRLLLQVFRSAALEAGYNVMSCCCPLSPFEKLEHLFIPALRLGFMTQNEYCIPDISPYKIIRARRFTDGELLKKARKRLTFNRKAAAQMLSQASRLLSEAKELHDQLETYYIGAMDFTKVDAIGAHTVKQISSLPHI